METINWSAADFRAYLKTLPEDASAGHIGNNQMCPLAQWRKNGYDEKVIVHTSCVWPPNEIQHNLPPWAEMFIMRVDARWDYQKIVLVKECLAVLDTIIAAQEEV